jgi:hypothetical protein
VTDALDRASAMAVNATDGTGPAVSRRWVLLASAAGFVGAIALGTSFGMLPSPPPVNGPLAALMRYATAHQHAMMTAAWLEGSGTLLYVIFVLALVHLAGDLAGLAGRVTTMASAVVVTVSLIYDVTLIAIAQSASLGGPQTTTALVAYGLFAAVEHIFLLAPPLLLPLGLILLRTPILPRPLAALAVVLGVASPILGLAGLFTVTANNNGPVGTVINALVALDGLWILVAAVVLTLRGPVPPRPAAVQPHPASQAR